MGIILERYFDGVRQERKKREETEGLLNSASQRKVLLPQEPGCFNSWNADKSLGKATLEAELFPGLPWAKAQLSCITSRFCLLAGGTLRVLQGRRDRTWTAESQVWPVKPFRGQVATDCASSLGVSLQPVFLMAVAQNRGRLMGTEWVRAQLDLPAAARCMAWCCKAEPVSWADPSRCRWGRAAGKQDPPVNPTQLIQPQHRAWRLHGGPPIPCVSCSTPLNRAGSHTSVRHSLWGCHGDLFVPAPSPPELLVWNELWPALIWLLGDAVWCFLTAGC